MMLNDAPTPYLPYVATNSNKNWNCAFGLKICLKIAAKNWMKCTFGKLYFYAGR